MYDLYSAYLIAFSTIAVFGVFSFLSRAVSIIRDWYDGDRVALKRKICVTVIMAAITAAVWVVLFSDDAPISFVDDRHQVVETMFGVCAALLSYLFHVSLAGTAARFFIKRPKIQPRTQIWQDGRWQDVSPDAVY